MRMPIPGNPTPISDDAPPSSGWLKVDFHMHTREDPKDCIEHTAIDLLHRAHTLGFHALAITLHDHVLTDPAVSATARELGIILIPAAEMRLEGADVVILNISQQEAAELRRLRDLEAFRQRRGNSALIFAPHPYYVLGGSIGRRLVKHIDLFDAIEISHFHTRWLNPNLPAIRAAERFNKPLIATSDCHRLTLFGDHYSLVQAARDATPEAIFAAIRANCVQTISPPLSTATFTRHLWWTFVEHPLIKLRSLSLKR